MNSQLSILEGFHNKKVMSSHRIDFLFYVRRELAEISSYTMLKVAPMRTDYFFIMKTITFFGIVARKL